MSFVVNGVKVKYNTITGVRIRLEEKHGNHGDSSITHTSISGGRDWLCKWSRADAVGADRWLSGPLLGPSAAIGLTFDPPPSRRLTRSLSLSPRADGFDLTPFLRWRQRHFRTSMAGRGGGSFGWLLHENGKYQ